MGADSNSDVRWVRWLCGAAVSLFVVIVLFRPGPPLLYGVDSACYARVARELAARPFSDWVRPTLGGEEFHEHPPLLFWIEALMFRLRGDSAASAVLVAHLFALLAGAFVFGTAWRTSGPRAAAFSLFCLLFLPGFLYEAQNPMLELPLLAWLACALFGLALMERSRALGVAVFAVGLTLAFWTKGPPAVAVLPLALWWAWRRRISWGTALLAVGAGLALTAATFGLFEWARSIHGDPSFLRAYLGKQVAVSLVEGRNTPEPSPFFFVPVLVRWYLPAILAAPLAIWAWRRSPEARPAIELGALLVALVFVGFSIPVQKHPWYIHPLAAGAALFMGATLSALIPARADRLLSSAATVVVALTIISFAARPALFAHHAPEIEAIQSTALVHPANASPQPIAYCGHLGEWQVEHLFAYFWNAQRVACDDPSAVWTFDGSVLARPARSTP